MRRPLAFLWRCQARPREAEQLSGAAKVNARLKEEEKAYASWAEQQKREKEAGGEISPHGLAVARGRLENQLADLVFPPKANAANERLAQHLWDHRDDLFTFLRQPGLDATNWWAELTIRFGVILRKVWGGNRTWAGAQAQSVLMSV